MTKTKEELGERIRESKCGVAFIVTKDYEYETHHFEDEELEPHYVVVNTAVACINACRDLMQLHITLRRLHKKHTLLTSECFDTLASAVDLVGESMDTLLDRGTDMEDDSNE